MNFDNEVWNYMTKTDKEIQCGFCGKIFCKRSKNLWQHLTKKHNIIKKPTVKDVKFKKSLAWDYFDKCQNDLGKAICRLCQTSISLPKVTRSTTPMINHLRSKHNLLGGHRRKTFLCSYCGKDFVSWLRRERCETTHSGKERFPCKFDVGCLKRFLTNKALERHISAVHKKEKTNICDECGKAFNQPIQLKTHSRIHTGETPFECDKCKKKFRFASSRHNHKCVAV